MAPRGLGRIARLTLFSGPQCSLCDTAKAELAKVRQQRPFKLETINIQDPGQERWKKKYVYWIPALHIEGKEVAKGRWAAQTVNQALDSWEASPWTKQDAEYVEQWLYHTPLYHRIHEDVVLGDGTGDGALDRDVQRCLNCGEPGHVVSKCPEPVDRRLVSLARQYFEFFRQGSFLPRLRVHEVEEWRRVRLEWLDKFEPGQIRGPVLREALGLEDGDPGERVPWLLYIAVWGYPPGWIGPRDPREHVWKRIHGRLQADDENENEDDSFYIFAEGEPELCQLSGDGEADSRHSRSRMPPTPDKHESDEASAAFVESFTRWAVYPDTYFLPSRLPIYTDQSRPSVRSMPPWRMPGAFNEMWQSRPTPMSLPLPLPPPPASAPPPLPPDFPPPMRHDNTLSTPNEADHSEMEMDSDDDNMDLSD
ncbi:hypothetical protein BD310DRAFT_804626 [Dichomitus squalens]|uniref:CCHC-type domain-containing protein n=1 Tax=Dichomitus squalens TaxID=114155 RepID=A0A4Q9QDR2_9APHY|nr:hypothetical protein BD310DRAFT_804626 [Dichomitus squalens]